LKAKKVRRRNTIRLPAHKAPGSKDSALGGLERERNELQIRKKLLSRAMGKGSYRTRMKERDTAEIEILSILVLGVLRERWAIKKK